MSRKDASSEGRAQEAAKQRLARSATFPGGSTSSKDVLRLAVDRAPLAELFAHGASTPDVEVCGVLVGYVGEDSAGKFVHVLAAIRGEQAREQGSHVTFTHETWNHIHSEMDRAYTSLEIVGWYHTHPGFGVFLSDMDAFIHQNFFGQPHQIALVYDPLAGKTAVFTLRDAKLVPLPRYWRDGRAIELDVPAGQEGPAGKSAGSTASSGKGGAELAALRESVARLEALVRQPRSRTWMEDWLVPTLLLALILLVSLQFFLTARGESPLVRDLAERYLILVELQRSGEIDIRDQLGRRVPLTDPTAGRTPGQGASSAPSPGPPRTTTPGTGDRR